MGTKKIEKTQENVFSFLAANALINRCAYHDMFNEAIEQEEIATIVAKNSEMSYNILYHHHNKINGNSKLILLQACIDNEECLTSLVSGSIYNFKPTNQEYSFIISYLLDKDNYELLSTMIDKKGINLDDTKKFKINKELKEKWEAFLVYHKLTN